MSGVIGTSEQCDLYLHLMSAKTEFSTKNMRPIN
jgi:hypothetical protein